MPTRRSNDDRRLAYAKVEDCDWEAGRNTGIQL